MKPEKLERHDLLFHPAHGLCRIDTVTRQRGAAGPALSYSLVPKMMSRMKVRFFISEADLEASGFHKIISVKEAHQILGYLKTGDSGTEQTGQTWKLARNILCFSKDKINTRDQRKRQQLEHSMKGLVGEIACVLQLRIKDAAARIEKSLAPALLKGNPLLLAALGRAAEA